MHNFLILINLCGTEVLNSNQIYISLFLDMIAIIFMYLFTWRVIPCQIDQISESAPGDPRRKNWKNSHLYIYQTNEHIQNWNAMALIFQKIQPFENQTNVFTICKFGFRPNLQSYISKSIHTTLLKLTDYGKIMLKRPFLASEIL